MSLIIEDVKVGDEYQLTTPALKGFVLNAIYTIEKIVGEYIKFKNATDPVYFENLVYFKKVKQSQYTFDDLIDAAKKAVRDRVLQSFTFGRDLKDLDLISVVSIDNQKHIFNYQSTESGIKYIQSLYKETFVIESHEDILRCKVGAAIALSNGNRDQVYAVDNNYKCLQLSKNRTWGAIGLFFLKGTTVEQERGCDD